MTQIKTWGDYFGQPEMMAFFGNPKNMVHFLKLQAHFYDAGNGESLMANILMDCAERIEKEIL